MKLKGLDCDKVGTHISDWLKSYAEEAGSSGYVVGISGGVDSALTSSLCALTGLRVICVQMPIHQAPDQLDRASEHIEKLKKNHVQVEERMFDLSPVFDQFSQTLSSEQSAQRELALANARARLRMSTLYLVAQTHGLLVAGTGNKVEDFGVGFYTKYGDGGVDLSPIADLNKSEVFALAAHLGVPHSILQAAPTDGLWADGRGDEDQLGASYAELEWAMEQVKEGMPDENWSPREREVMGIYTHLHNANRHKMQEIPVCPIPEMWKSETPKRIDSPSRRK
ncbi:MAG: NH(3)-dependent NAD(+) synthetase [Flavobacteriia bacterium]|nr:MAG: NH(3)-dependent NAD(+) synthetase [Flavobacteriia bacterium]